MAGPLSGLRIIEMAGIGPAPFASMLLGDLGADVIRVDRLEPIELDKLVPPEYAIQNRSRRSIGVDATTSEGREIILRLAETADGFTESFRPGVAERLGIGPEVCLARNSKLVYGRMTGWGQDGPWSSLAGHDINYIATAGVLDAIGLADGAPIIPLNLVGDFGGGGMLFAFGMVCGLLEATKTGAGQVVDSSMMDGASILFSAINGMRQAGFWSKQRGTNFVDSGSHFYNVYETKDGRYLAVGAIEPKFYLNFIRTIGYDGNIATQMDAATWPQQKRMVAAIIVGRTLAEWVTAFDGVDACVTPVLTAEEAGDHAHAEARGAVVDIDGVRHPAPAPRFSHWPGLAPKRPPKHAEHTGEILSALDFSDAEVADLRARKIIS